MTMKIYFPIAVVILAFFCLSLKAQSPNYHFDEQGISRKVLENYLDRSITVVYLLMPDKPEGNRIYSYHADDMRMVKELGAKFIGRAIYRWGGESKLNNPDFWRRAKALAEELHAWDAEMVLQGCLFEVVTREVDKVKNIFRQTYLADGKRKENDAEHSWHLALAAVLLKEHMKEDADLGRVMTMVLIHDLVEIDAGDTYAYDTEGAATKREREVKAADRIFGILPEDQGTYLRELWDEFEAYETAEAKYAHLLDNFQPLMLNDASDGKSWEEHGVHKSQVCRRYALIPETSEIVWEKMLEIMDKHIEKGHLQAD